MSTQPTSEGLKRYPQTGGYNKDLVEPIACICLFTYVARCAGGCGCFACAIQFTEVLRGVVAVRWPVTIL